MSALRKKLIDAMRPHRARGRTLPQALAAIQGDGTSGLSIAALACGSWRVQDDQAAERACVWGDKALGAMWTAARH